MLLCFAVFGVARADEVVIGDTESTSTQYYLPVNMYYHYSMTQQIFTAEEIGMAGTINSIAFDYAYTNEFSMENVQIYMMNVDKENFESTSDMVQISASDLVWEGTFTASATGWVTIDLDTPFAYDGSSNLLVCCYDPTSGYPGNSYKFRTTATTDYLALAYYSDSAIPSLEDVSTYNGSKYRYQYRTNIQLDITPSSVQPCYKPTLAVSEITHNQATLTVGGGSGTYNVQYKLASDRYQISGTFPLDAPEPAALYGSGARHTLYGGTGSGEVNTRYDVSICDGLAEAGFEIASTGWLDRYDEIYDSTIKAYMDKVETTAKERGVPATSVYFEMALEAPVMPLITEEDVAARQYAWQLHPVEQSVDDSGQATERRSGFAPFL